MPTSLRDYWWAVLIVPVAVVVTAILVTGLFTGSDPSPGSAVAAAITSSAPAPSSRAPTSSARTAVEDAVACAGNTGTRLVTVSISEQRMWMCQGTRTVSASPVTTGIDNATDRTPTGTWKVVARETDRFLVGGPDYRVHVDYFLPFFDDYGFHDSPWQKFPYGSQDYRTGGSRGCIHVPGPEMAALYRWAAVGTTVTVRA